MARRVLVLTYYFPPSGGPGVQRVLKFAKYLPTCGWTPVVLTVEEGTYPARDPSLWQDVPASAEVHRTASWDPYQLYARLTGQSREEAVVQGSVKGEETSFTHILAQWVRANVILPDARVGWVPFAVWRGWQLLADGGVDAILTTGPPHSTHLAGAALQALTGTPWVADFRDPWTDINYYQELPHTRWAQWLDAALERLVLLRARAVTTVSPSWRDLLSRKVQKNGRSSRRFSVVQNGFDTDDIPRSPARPAADAFELTHVGSLYASRNPEALWRALRRLLDMHDSMTLRVRLVGSVDPNVSRSLEAHGLMSITTHVPYVPHAEALTYMRQAGLLVLSIESFPEANGMMTGKIYEYLASGRPVVGIGPPGGDAAALLRTTEGGRLFGQNEVAGLAHFIRDHYRAWERGNPFSGASSDALRPYRRQGQTERMAGVLDAVTAAAL
jgi:glycosyltransferase involved in cell wall biosynthesis